MSNPTEDDRVHDLRTCLNAYFSQMAAEADVELNPTPWDDRTMALSGRIYDEKKGDRLFYISPRARRGVDGFVKRTGVDDEYILLQVFTEFSAACFPVLWDAYFKWIHKRVDEREALAALEAS